MTTMCTACRTRTVTPNRNGDLAHDESLLDQNEDDQHKDDRQGAVMCHAAMVVVSMSLPS